MLGICYGFQEMSHALGGFVDKAAEREFGHATIRVVEGAPAGSELFAGLGDSFRVWMSHGDKIHSVPPGFTAIAATDNCEFAAAAGLRGACRMWGLQFHPEVTHTPGGLTMLRNFAVTIAGCKQDWSMASFLGGEWGVSLSLLHQQLQLCVCVTITTMFASSHHVHTIAPGSSARPLPYTYNCSIAVPLLPPVDCIESIRKTTTLHIQL